MEKLKQYRITLDRNAQDYRNNIISLPQLDNIQREGVLTMRQEKILLEKAGQLLTKTIDKNVQVADAEIEALNKEKEIFDILDEKREIDKIVKKNKEEFERLKKENGDIINKVEEHYRQIQESKNIQSKTDNSK